MTGMRYNTSTKKVLSDARNILSAVKLSRSLTVDTIPHSPGVYQILCVPTGKIYIGSAVDLWDRWRVHRNDLTGRYGRSHHSIYLQRAWDKYGADAFEFSILEFCERSCLIEREQYYLDLMQACDPTVGFNTLPLAASMLGRKASAETRRKQSVAHTGRKHPPMTDEQKRAISERNKGHTRWLGRKHTPEAIEHQRAAKKGTKWSEAATLAHIEATSKWFVFTDPDGHEIVAKNMQEFCRQHGLSSSGFYRVLSGRYETYRGWKCRYAE